MSCPLNFLRWLLAPFRTNDRLRERNCALCFEVETLRELAARQQVNIAALCQAEHDWTPRWFETQKPPVRRDYLVCVAGADSWRTGYWTGVSWLVFGDIVEWWLPMPAVPESPRLQMGAVDHA